MRHNVNLSIARRLLATLCLVLVAASASAQFSGSGSGTSDDPYRIYNAAQLNQVRNFLDDEDVVFSLEADIDMTDWIADNNPVQGWSPIGNSSNAFCGTFNGNGHTISNLWIKRPDTDYIGLFGNVESGYICDLTLTYARYEGKDRVGGIVGYSYRSGISNCNFLNGVIKGGDYVGGIVGNFVSYRNNISNCSFQNGNINGNDNVGGIVGHFSRSDTSAEIVKSYSFNACISGNNSLGGIIGSYDNTSSLYYNKISSCFSNVKIYGANYIGGLIGRYNQNETNDDNGNITISSCFSNVKIYGANYIGGLIGYLYLESYHRSVSCEDSYAIGLRQSPPASAKLS